MNGLTEAVLYTNYQVSTNASVGLEPIVENRVNDHQSFLFQLYMNRDRSKSTAILQKVAAMRGQEGQRLFKAVVLTVDAPAPGKREPDEKAQAAITLVRVIFFICVQLTLISTPDFGLVCIF
jgi:isopentenyl diphosphate isomerase/L-lactate dehydrogenase-like FMN-dependent dehydrogenase